MKTLLFTLLVGFVLCSCSSKRSSSKAYESRLYEGNYDEVWLATLKSLSDYPLKISNKDVGKIHTEIINGPYNDLLFEYPDPIDVPERFRYSLRLRFAKLETEKSKPLVRVRVIKKLERYQDFYTGWVPYPSDVLEEKVLLYRVEHLLKMDQILGKKGF